MHFDWRHIHPLDVRFLLPDTASLADGLAAAVLLVVAWALLFELLFEVLTVDGAVLRSALRSMVCPSGDEIA